MVLQQEEGELQAKIDEQARIKDEIKALEDQLSAASSADPVQTALV